MSIGPTEALLIAGAIVLLFGSSRLPQLMSALGKGIREFKRAVRGDEEQSDQTKGSGQVEQTDAKKD